LQWQKQAGDLGLYHAVTQACFSFFLLKRSHYVFTVSAAQAFLPAEYEWKIVQRGG
jgi:hypothetical protein